MYSLFNSFFSAKTRQNYPYFTKCLEEIVSKKKLRKISSKIYRVATLNVISICKVTMVV